ncbi:hypothetical protein LY90DRAFT_670864 [Neocallimastix californiae]|uniref:Choice-of-anchor A domain-containing protein n=1 Tax=Neocallimastix californiae TaxID=1754190 RepID=A0A1Y2CRQ1_9FUNG|nr:hypothetical protein LY90DRAFT_670864 [Neocallimastix californiae]|eukprot:ORY49708.1 hypothetical protein LY90DRAFT_670864 [Neocallimastix californiae]
MYIIFYLNDCGYLKTKIIKKIIYIQFWVVLTKTATVVKKPKSAKSDTAISDAVKVADKNENIDNQKNEKLADEIVEVIDEMIESNVKDEEAKKEIIDDIIDALEKSDNEEEKEEADDSDIKIVEDKDNDDDVEVVDAETESGTDSFSEDETESEAAEIETEKDTPTPTGECSTEVFGVVQQFNGFFFGDFTGFSSDVQGRLAAKGTVNISGGYQNGAFTYDPVSHSRQTYLDCTDGKMKGDIKYSIIAGSLNFRDGGEILNGGVAYQKSVQMPGYINEAIKRHKCSIDKKNINSIVDFDKEKKNVSGISERLSQLKVNTKSRNEWGRLVIDLVPGKKVQVVKIDNLSQFWGIQINENGVNMKDTTIVFNLNYDNVTFMNFDISNLNKYATNILWNIPKARKVHIENFRIQGSLLAPNADIQGTNGNIQGQMIGNSFKGNLQIDWVPFYGCI